MANHNKAIKRQMSVRETKFEPVKKALKKNEIIQQLEELQLKYLELEKENISLLKKMDSLKNKEMASTSEKISVGVQTILFEEDIIRCKECEYPAEDIYDLGEHMHEFHGENTKEALDCHYCDEIFQTKKDLMVHRKRDHPEKVNTCYYFLQGICNFGEDCWYNHKKEDLELKIQCNLCDSTLRSKPDLMQHRKKQHRESVKHCRDDKSGNCRFDEKKCWFIHTECKEIDTFDNYEK